MEDKKIEMGYRVQRIEKMCGNCQYAEDDPITCVLSEEYRCEYCGKVDWNAICDKHKYIGD